MPHNIVWFKSYRTYLHLQCFQTPCSGSTLFIMHISTLISFLHNHVYFSSRFLHLRIVQTTISTSRQHGPSTRVSKMAPVLHFEQSCSMIMLFTGSIARSTNAGI